jgi:hypothetical protein
MTEIAVLGMTIKPDVTEVSPPTIGPESATFLADGKGVYVDGLEVTYPAGKLNDGVGDSLESCKVVFKAAVIKNTTDGGKVVLGKGDKSAPPVIVNFDNKSGGVTPNPVTIEIKDAGQTKAKSS